MVERLRSVRWRVALFFVLTLSLTTAATFGWRQARGTWEGLGAMGFLNLVMLVPGLVALGLQRFVFAEPLKTTLAWRRPTWGWLATAWLLAPLLMLLALAVGTLLPGVKFSPDLAGLGMLLVQALLVGPTVCLLGGLGEELGWRGFLYTELEPLGFWAQSATVGLLWGIWHLPLTLQGYAYPQHPFVGSLLLLALMQALAPIYGRLRARSDSVFVPAVFHGTCSASGLIAVSFVSGGGELLTGFTGVAGLVAAVCVAAGFLAATAARPASG